MLHCAIFIYQVPCLAGTSVNNTSIYEYNWDGIVLMIEPLILANDPFLIQLLVPHPNTFCIWPLGGARYLNLTAEAEDLSHVLYYHPDIYKETWF